MKHRNTTPSARIRPGDFILAMERKKEYAIVYVGEEFSVLCERSSKTKLVLNQISTTSLIENLDAKTFVLESHDETVIDESSMSDISRNNYHQKRAIIKDVSTVYGPTYLGLIGRKKKPELDSIYKKYHITKATLLRTINIYLQSGCQLSSLIEKRGLTAGNYKQSGTKFRGRKPTEGPREAKALTELDIKFMQESIELLKNQKSHVATKKDAYIDMLTRHYTKNVINADGTISRELLPIGEFPSIKQYYNYASKTISKQEFDIIKTSAREHRNDKRALHGTERGELTYPGELCDIDATPVDIYLVSKSDPTQLVNLKRYDSDHKKTACMDISDMRTIMVSYILYHNGRVIESRMRSPEMIDNNVSSSPVELWKFYSRLNAPHIITMDINQYIWALMKPARASKTRQGIKFKGLFYICNQDVNLGQFMMQYGPAVSMDIRYDESSMEHIFYVSDGRLYTARLNPAYTEQLGYASMSYDMFMSYRSKERAQLKNSRHANLKRHIEQNERLEAIASGKEASPQPEKTSRIKENTRREKEADNREHSISSLIEKEPIKPDADISTISEAKKEASEQNSADAAYNDEDLDRPIREEAPDAFREAFLKKYGYKK